MSDETFDAWVTKYALTSGIRKISARACGSPGMIADTDERHFVTQYFFNDEWHTSPADALAQAEKMRVRKIASLRKQIAKLESLDFSGPAA